MRQKPAEERPDPGPAEEPWSWAYSRSSASGAYDELFGPDGRIRAPWTKIAAMLGRLGKGELRRRWDQARVLLHEHGVSYDAYRDPEGVSRPWSLSPIPVIISSAEWEKIAAGLAQRALLLDTILADLYGPQTLVASGDVPAELLFAHPAFLHPCVGIVPLRKHYLPLYAADLARCSDGHVLVLADRTRSPSGAGYALENRIVLSRCLPDVFRECGVERLALFFRTMRDTLRDLAPYNRDNPRIVHLTPGPYNATYFEQAFLAQYLGFTLVQGGDLTVRNQRVYLKTLGGLQSVDVVVRRLNDEYCDPLELRPDSSLGIPGLVEAVRAGNVAIANPIGSGLLQTPLLMPLLPALCRKLLGEELALPSVPTYWCGHRESLAYVEAHLTELVIKPAFPVGSTEPIFARELTARGLDDLRARIRHDPRSYVAQDAVVLSTVPTLFEDELAPAHLWMRAYLVVSGDHYEVMPGALSRVGGPDDNLALSLQPGGESKDTWILAGGPVSEFTLLRSPGAPAVLSRGGGNLPSRVADNLFWLGRYAERSEGAARLARAIGLRLADQTGTGESVLSADLDALFRGLTAQTGVAHPLTDDAARSGDAGGAARPNPRPNLRVLATAERRLLAAIMDSDPHATLSATVAATHRVARTVRDRVSGDTWRILAQVDQDMRSAQGVTGPRALGAVMNLLNRVVIALAAFSGLAVDSMSRGQAWRFLDAGRRLERAVHLTRLLQAVLGSRCTNEGPALESLLEVADSSMTYRRRYLATLQTAPVVDLLLTDETNPRSVLFQVVTLGDHIEALPRDAGVPRTPQQKLILAAVSELRLAEVTEICAPSEEGERPRLNALLERVGGQLRDLSSSISGAYLNHSVMSRQLQGDS